MSQENIDVVLGLLRAVSRDDYDTAAFALDANAEWHNTAVFPGPRTVRGASAICQFWKEMFESYGGFGESGGEIERLTEGDDVVVVLMHSWWRAEAGVPLDTQWAMTFWLRDGKIIRGEAHGHHGKALKAAGLRE